MAERCIRSLLDSAPDAEIVCEVDNDPETVKRILSLQPKRLKLRHHQGHRGCSRAWNDALAVATGDPIVFAADDLIFRPGWLESALEELKPGGMVGFNDGHWGEELSTHYMMDRKFIKEVLGGRVAWECYKHSFNDLETCHRARKAGRYAWCANALVYHSHWLFGDREKDETDTRRLPDHPEDERIFKERQAAGFPDDLEPVI